MSGTFPLTPPKTTCRTFSRPAARLGSQPGDGSFHQPSARLRVCDHGDPEGAQAAIAQVNGKNVQGRDLTVNEARPREERSGGGGGGGGRGGYGGGGGGGGRSRQYSR